ncbi:MAG: ral secretion pathway protein [Thermoanaerobaculia bacterium]|jgi:general secretion pathway protein G|nr:ral secretion pathway protein [Thermoanaerobaculia bacterium]
MQYCAHCGNAVEAVSYAPCPRCGSPTNGAPRAAAGAKTNPAIIVVIVIVVGLVLVAFLGIIAAIAIPNFITGAQRAKQKRTMADIRSLATAVEAYNVDNNEYPKGASPSELTPLLVPKYIKVVRVDGWGNPLRYACLKDATAQDSEKCAGYVIGSAGKDARFEQDSMETAATHSPQSTSNFDCDIIYSNGSFVEYPEGAQR